MLLFLSHASIDRSIERASQSNHCTSPLLSVCGGVVWWWWWWFAVFFDDTKTGCLFWSEGKERSESAANSLALAHITSIVVGKNAPAWKKPFAEGAREECCFSIIGKDCTLDVETKLPKTRDAWVRGLQVLAKSKNIKLTVS